MHPSLRRLTSVNLIGVEVWTAQLDSLSTDELQELRAYLNPEERKRAARFHFPHDAQRYASARGLLRCLLGALSHQSPSALHLEYGPHGKPALVPRSAQTSELRFNLSHSAGRALFAVARDREVGIDLESHARLDRNEEDLSRLAGRILTAAELAVWRNLPDASARRSAFLRAWTRKEACGKALGRGIFEGVMSLEVILDAAAPNESMTVARAAISPGLTSHLWVQDLAAPADFAAAIAVELIGGEPRLPAEAVTSKPLAHA